LKSISYSYSEDGHSSSGRKLPDLPTVKLLLRRKDRRLQARGQALVDTGFDGGIYPSIDLLIILEGMKPKLIEHLYHPLYGKVDCEVYELEAFLIDGEEHIRLGPVMVYVPTESEYISEEALLGREIINKGRMMLDGLRSKMRIEIKSPASHYATS